MRIDVVGRNLEITPAIREYAESRVQKLPRFFDGVSRTLVTLNKADHQKSGLFGVEFVIDVEKHESFVAKASDADLYAAIDQTLAKAQRQLHDFKEKFKQGNR